MDNSATDTAIFDPKRFMTELCWNQRKREHSRIKTVAIPEPKRYAQGLVGFELLLKCRFRLRQAKHVNENLRSVYLEIRPHCKKIDPVLGMGVELVSKNQRHGSKMSKLNASCLKEIGRCLLASVYFESWIQRMHGVMPNGEVSDGGGHQTPEPANGCRPPPPAQLT